LSSYWLPGEDIVIDMFPETNLEEVLLQAKKNKPRSRLRTILSDYLPRALVLELQTIHWSDIDDTPLAEIPDKTLVFVALTLRNWVLTPTATEGYRTAEVTLGGVDTDEISSKTMECKAQPGLYCIGEVVDVTGHLGGYNFQWAWSSGYAAGLVA